METWEKKLIDHLESLPSVSPGEDFSWKVINSIRAEQEKRQTKRVHWFNFKKALAFSLVGVFLGLMLLTDLPLTPRLETINSSSSKKIELVFCPSSQNPRTVAVAGDFSSWDYLHMEKVQDSCWSITIEIKPGRYQYGFLIDGEQWVPDPGSLRQVSDGFGGVNSVLIVENN